MFPWIHQLSVWNRFSFRNLRLQNLFVTLNRWYGADLSDVCPSEPSFLMAETPRSARLPWAALGAFMSSDMEEQDFPRRSPVSQPVTQIWDNFSHHAAVCWAPLAAPRIICTQRHTQLRQSRRLTDTLRLRRLKRKMTLKRSERGCGDARLIHWLFPDSSLTTRHFAREAVSSSCRW